jgi:hypothetical protein
MMHESIKYWWKESVSPRCSGTGIHIYLLPAETPDPSSQLHILRHNRDALAMDGTEVAILEEADKMCLRGLLQGENGSALPTVRLPGHVGLDLADEPGEREAANQQVGRVLIRSDLL